MNVELILSEMEKEGFIEKDNNSKYSLTSEFEKCINDELKADDDIERAITKAKWAFRLKDA